ncbi:MAG: LTA synthase family protein [Endomicrobium sp.]|nr:LTA synthase family protein [Endomicrobium sp.]
MIVLMLSADFFYFPEVRRHMTEDIILAWRDKDFIITYIIKNYLWILILICVLSIYFTKKIFKFIDRQYSPKYMNLFKQISILFVVIVIVVLGIRSNFYFKERPLNLTNAYRLLKKTENIQLILNGVFTQYHSLVYEDKEKGVINNGYPLDQGLKNARNFLLSDNEIFSNEEYPLMRCLKNTKKTSNYNVVIILLESWTPKYIDSFNGNIGYGVTPAFDKIAEGGIKFVNAYSAGSRSQYGLIASLIGMQAVHGVIRYYGFDMMSRITQIAQPFNKRGYFTMYAQSFPRKSIYMCSVAKGILNFSEAYGSQDYTKLMDISNDYDDYAMFDFISKKLEEIHNQGKPFFIYAFTGTTHVPFIQTTSQFEKYPPISNENKYLNTLYYADYSIGYFIEKAKKDGYFDNTIVIFMADHPVPFALHSMDTKQRFKIPFVIYAPKIFKPQVIKHTVSQADLIPTLYHLMNINEPFSAVGVNALDNNANHFALICDGMNIVFVDKNGDYVTSNRDVIMESSLKKNDTKYYELNNILLSLDKSIVELFIHNRWYT